MHPHYSEEQLSSCLRHLGVTKGTCLFVHSGLRNLGKFTPNHGADGLEGLLAGFLDVIGPSGTLVVPAFNFGFCKGKPFDRQNTPSEGMGAFSEFVRLQPSARRSHHPFQSVSAIGQDASTIERAQGRGAFSPGGAFDTMLQANCKILFFGVDFVETFVHVAEERANVPYRSWITFTSEYIDHGVSRRLSIDFFARNLHLRPEPVIDKPRVGRALREKKIITSASLGSGQVSICDASAMVNELTERLVENPSYVLQAAAR